MHAMTEQLRGEALTNWIVERLTRFRENTGMTVEAFAKLSGISVRYIHRVEKRKAVPSITIIDEWLTACKKDFGAFFESIAHVDAGSGDKTKWHDFLDQILESVDDFAIDGVRVVEGIKLNLLAIAREVNRTKKGNRKTHSPPPGKRPRAS